MIYYIQIPKGKKLGPYGLDPVFPAYLVVLHQGGTFLVIPQLDVFQAVPEIFIFSGLFEGVAQFNGSFEMERGISFFGCSAQCGSRNHRKWR